MPFLPRVLLLFPADELLPAARLICAMPAVRRRAWQRGLCFFFTRRYAVFRHSLLHDAMIILLMFTRYFFFFFAFPDACSSRARRFFLRLCLICALRRCRTGTHAFARPPPAARCLRSPSCPPDAISSLCHLLAVFHCYASYAARRVFASAAGGAAQKECAQQCARCCFIFFFCLVSSSSPTIR